MYGKCQKRQNILRLPDTDNKELKQQIISLEKEIEYLKDILEYVPNSMEDSDYTGESE